MKRPTNNPYEQLLRDLQRANSQQAQKIEQLEVLLYNLEGRQRHVEESIGEAASEPKFLTALNRWIEQIDREISRERP